MPLKPIPALLASAAALVALLVLPAAAPAAKVNIAVGIGDQSAAMFANPHFKALKVKKARYFVRWDAIDDPTALARADEWLRAAKTAGVRPLLHLDGLDIDRNTRPPSVSLWRSKVKALVARYRRGSDGRASVPDWGVWNEANSKTQPVYRLSGARRTAKYFLALRSLCRGCQIVALDLLDARNYKGYIRAFYGALGSRKRFATIVGIHNYGDTNRPRNNTGAIIDTVRRYNRRAKFWLTETGGIALLQNTDPKTGRLRVSRGLGCNPARPGTAERRQARAVAKMFRIARRYRRHVKRLYPYNFYGTDCDLRLRFDAGLLRSDGSRRPAYATLKRAMRSFRR
ncbi:MAG TPA: hypothetical protein VGW75_11830 [Solirubrobacteraceae bacterium]|jgi:hypothetical protein|nr:hypothetical protein [Solirubrobacteraceae bacterium]